MYKLKDLFGHVQEVQAAGKTLNKVRTQMIRHAARMEEAHRELAHALARVGLIDVIEELASVPFKQYKVKVAELVRATQANDSRMEVPKQEEDLNPSRAHQEHHSASQRTCQRKEQLRHRVVRRCNRTKRASD